MDDSEEIMSTEDVKSDDSIIKMKPKKRSLVERELETSLTPWATSPVTNGDVSTTSRFGRARRLKTNLDYCDTDKAVTRVLKSPYYIKSPTRTPPAYKMHALNSPEVKSSKTTTIEVNLEDQIENIYSTNISLSRFSSDDKTGCSAAKKHPKIYSRKDLIQTKEKEETVTLIKNMFSPYKGTNSHLNNVLERSSEKYSLNKTIKSQNGYLDTSSVVKALDFDSKEKKKDKECKVMSKTELFETEAKAEYQVGDLAWARMATYPFWPCIVTREPGSDIFIKKKLFGRIERDVIHVTFFGDNGRRSWIVPNMMRKFQGLKEFEAARDKFHPGGKKERNVHAAFFISEKKLPLWLKSVEEADSLQREPKRLRIDLLNEMLWRSKLVTVNTQKGNKVSRTDSDVSLSESLYDTLFSEDDGKNDDADKSLSKRKNSLDVSEVVTACLDNMAAKSGITKIQKQSHMDRWLQKAKSKTPEKSQFILNVTERMEKDREKDVTEKDRMKNLNERDTKKSRERKRESKRKVVNQVPVQVIKPYRLRKSAKESQSLISFQDEHDYSLKQVVVKEERKEITQDSNLVFVKEEEKEITSDPNLLIPDVPAAEVFESLPDKVEKDKQDTIVVIEILLEANAESEQEIVKNVDCLGVGDNDKDGKNTLSPTGEIQSETNEAICEDDVSLSLKGVLSEKIKKPDNKSDKLENMNNKETVKDLNETEEMVNKPSLEIKINDFDFNEKDIEFTVGQAKRESLQSNSVIDKEICSITVEHINTDNLILSNKENRLDDNLTIPSHDQINLSRVSSTGDNLTTDCGEADLECNKLLARIDELIETETILDQKSDNMNNVTNIDKVEKQMTDTDIQNDCQDYGNKNNEDIILSQDNLKEIALDNLVSVKNTSIKNNACIVELTETISNKNTDKLKDASNTVEDVDNQKLSENEIQNYHNVNKEDVMVTQNISKEIYSVENTSPAIVQDNTVKKRSKSAEIIPKNILTENAKKIDIYENGTLSDSTSDETEISYGLEENINSKHLKCLAKNVVIKLKKLENISNFKNLYASKKHINGLVQSISEPDKSEFVPTENVSLVINKIEDPVEPNLSNNMIDNSEIISESVNKKSTNRNGESSDTISLKSMDSDISLIDKISGKISRNEYNYNEYLESELLLDSETKSTSEMDNVCLSDLTQIKDRLSTNHLVTTENSLDKKLEISKDSENTLNGSSSAIGMPKVTDVISQGAEAKIGMVFTVDAKVEQEINLTNNLEVQENVLPETKQTNLKDVKIISMKSEASTTSMTKCRDRTRNEIEKMNEPEFLKYVQLKQNQIMDEHPELNCDELTTYLYKTWLHEEGLKSDKKQSDDYIQSNTVIGLDTEGNSVSDLPKVKEIISQNAEVKNGMVVTADGNEEQKINLTDNLEVKENVLPETEEMNLKDIKIISTKSESSTNSMAKYKGRTRNEVEKMKEPEFLKYVELKQDEIMEEHPELNSDEITTYLYKTWLYEEGLKSDKKKTDDYIQSNTVKGLDSEPVKKNKKKKNFLLIDIDRVMSKAPNKSNNSGKDDFITTKEKPKRIKVQPYYNEDFSDIEDEIKMFEIFNKKDKGKITMENDKCVPKLEESIKTDVVVKTEPNTSNSEELVVTEEYYDEEELYFEQLTTPKPNIFKGLIRERVCESCEKPNNLIKCKRCHGMFHLECDVKKTENIEVPVSVRGRKKKKRGRGRPPKYSLDSNLDDSLEDKSADVSDELNLSGDAKEIENIVLEEDNFENVFAVKMKEVLESSVKDNYDSYSSDDGIDWKDTVAGQCEIVEVKLKPRAQSIQQDYSDWKCKSCEKNETPICFVCKSNVSPKKSIELRQKCQVAHCHKYYHLECLEHWPQTQFNSGEPSRNNKKINEHFEALSCPRHVCHTCVCDDPRGCKTRFSGDKLARCVRCPATYHSFTKCLPAGSQILTASHIICPRHYEHRPGKVPCHVNTGWCFICALGGTLICCEYCPTSFHAECLNIDPPEGGYMCEDCETGRLPLYGEMVWVKLGHYRWWPGIVLHPSEIPENIYAVKHSPGEFVVRFFGQYDHYWVNRGRVFPFQEGDSGRVSAQKSKIDEAFTIAMEHAHRAFDILKNTEPNEEESMDIASSLLPPHYVKLKVNRPCGSLYGRRVDIEESSLTQCDCDPDVEDPCGPYSQCLNRMLLTECGPGCRAGDRCNNRAFEKRLYPKMVPYRTPHRGWGLKTLEDVRAGQFVIEYVGELIDEEEFRRRMGRKHEIRDENFYFLTLDKERMIDAGPKGNLARFMNHCCEPNCETQKWTVLGDVRVGLFALRDIPANSELTFNYNLECAGIEKKRCLCGAKRCSGYIGAKPKQDEPKKTKLTPKRTYKKRKTIEISPVPSKTKPKRPVGRPSKEKPRELTEIEKDLLIIKNATNGLSSDSESSRLSSDEKKDTKPLKRKRVSFSTEEIILYNSECSSPSLKRVRLDENKSSSEVAD